MANGSKPWFVADALARDDVERVRQFGRKGARARAEKRAREAENQDNEDDLHDQIDLDPTIKRAPKPQIDDEYKFGGPL